MVNNQTGFSEYRTTLFTNFNLSNLVQKIKHKHGEKMNTHTSSVSTKLEMGYKRSFNKAVIKYFCKISFKDFGTERNLVICMHVFSCTLENFCIHGTYTDKSIHAIAQALDLF